MQKNSIVDIDNSKTIEFINFLLKEKSEIFSTCGCITEKGLGLSGNDLFDFHKSFITNHLDIKDSVHFNTQMNLYKNFKMTNEIVPDKKIYKEKQYRELIIKNYGSIKAIDEWIKENCKGAYCSISKPIFNKTYDLALVYFSVFLEGSKEAPSGYKATKTYQFKEGKWIEKSHLGSAKW